MGAAELNSQRLFNWIQIVTGLAVVCGLVLVTVELRQTQDIAKAQLVSDTYAYIVGQQSVLMGEDSAGVISKACANPTELTASDLEVLNGYYGGILNRSRRAFSIERHSGIRYGGEPEAIARSNFGIIFDTPYGRWWWQSVSRFYEPEVREIGDSMMQSISDSVCYLHLEDYRAWLDESPFVK